MHDEEPWPRWGAARISGTVAIDRFQTFPRLHISCTLLLRRASGNKFSHLSFGEFSSTVLMQATRNNVSTASSLPPLSASRRLNTRSERRLSQQQPPGPLPPQPPPPPPPGPSASWRSQMNNQTDVDWVAAGVVTPIRDQGLQCGECDV